MCLNKYNIGDGFIWFEPETKKLLYGFILDINLKLNRVKVKSKNEDIYFLYL